MLTYKTEYSLCCVWCAFIIVLCILNSLYGCSIVKYSEIQDLPCEFNSTYKFSQNISGLFVSVDPYLDKYRTIKYFGEDVSETRNLLPVFILIENRSSNKVFLVEKSNFRMAFSKNMNVRQNAEVLDEKEQDQFMNRGGVNTSNALGNTLGAGLILVPPVAIIGLAAMAIGDSQYDRYIERHTEITENMDRKELLDRTIFPGESQNGFVYFSLADKGIYRAEYIQVNVMELKSNKETTCSVKIVE